MQNKKQISNLSKEIINIIKMPIDQMEMQIHIMHYYQICITKVNKHSFELERLKWYL